MIQVEKVRNGILVANQTTPSHVHLHKIEYGAEIKITTMTLSPIDIRTFHKMTQRMIDEWESGRDD